jgi:hypothetical protein
MKISQKFIFHPCESHILSQLNITTLYTIFWDFKKYRVLAQKPKGLAFRFTDKCSFTVKTGQKSVFYPLKAHVMSQLNISMLYINFLVVLKNIEFRLKTQGGSLRFYRKTSIRGENKLKNHISSFWDSYSISVWCFGVVHKILCVFKNIESQFKTQWG